jgi:hypothetical protein
LSHSNARTLSSTRFLAYHALAMLARLFRHGELIYHGGFVNPATGKMAALPIRSMAYRKR